MKTDNPTESNPHTIICSNNNSKSSSQSLNKILILFHDNTQAYYHKSTLSCINPIFFSQINNNNETELSLPPGITNTLLMEYLFIMKNGIEEVEDADLFTTKKIISLLIIGDFFQNEAINLEIIHKNILPNLTKDNAFIYLEYSFKKLNHCNSLRTESEGQWFNLFYKCLETIGKNPFSMIDNKDIVDRLEAKVLQELMLKCCGNLLLGNYFIIDSEGETDQGDDDSHSIGDNSISNNENFDEINYFDSGINKESSNNDKVNDGNDILMKRYLSIRKLEQMIEYLYKVHSNSNNFFDLMTNEYMYIYSHESIREVKESPYPTFSIHIPYDFDNYFYEEFTIDLKINNKNVIIVMFYQQNDDSFNVSIKLNDIQQQHPSQSQSPLQSHDQSHHSHFFQIFSFISIVKFNENIKSLPNTIQTNLKSFSNNKSMYNIFKFLNFKNTFKHKKTEQIKNIICPRTKCFTINNEGIIYHHIFSSENEESNEGDEEEEEKDEGNEKDIVMNREYFQIKIHLKLCFVYSLLASYFLRNFTVLAYQPKINKLSKHLLFMVLKSKYIKKHREDDVITAVINWLDDEINMKENISEIFNIINWKSIKEDLLFEFIMKYSHMFNEEEYIERIVKIIKEKVKCKDDGIMNKIMMSVYKAARKVNYVELIGQLHKENKVSLICHKKEIKKAPDNRIANNDIISSKSNGGTQLNSPGGNINANNTQSSNYASTPVNTHYIHPQYKYNICNNNNKSNSKRIEYNSLLSPKKVTSNIFIPITTQSAIDKLVKCYSNNKTNKSKRQSHLHNKSLLNNNPLYSAKKITHLKISNSTKSSQAHIPIPFPISRNKPHQFITPSLQLSKLKQRLNSSKPTSAHNRSLSNNVAQTHNFSSSKALNTEAQMTNIKQYRYQYTTAFRNSKLCSFIKKV